MKQRVLIIIDGSNFYYKLKELKLERTLKLDFTKMVDFLSDTNRSVEACYYVGRIRQDKTKKSKQLFDAQQKLLGSLKKIRS